MASVELCVVPALEPLHDSSSFFRNAHNLCPTKGDHTALPALQRLRNNQHEDDREDGFPKRWRTPAASDKKLSPNQPIAKQDGNYQPPLAQLLSPESMLEAIRKQIEFYFSDESLPTDNYLTRKMDENGFVRIKHIAEFKRVKRITRDMSVVVEALKTSKALQLNADATRVRRIAPLPKVDPEEIAARTIVIRNLKSNPTISSLTEQFSGFGRVRVARVFQPGLRSNCTAEDKVNDVNNELYATVEFDAAEEARCAVMSYESIARTFGPDYDGITVCHKKSDPSSSTATHHPSLQRRNSTANGAQGRRSHGSPSSSSRTRQLSSGSRTSSAAKKVKALFSPPEEGRSWRSSSDADSRPWRREAPSCSSLLPAETRRRSSSASSLSSVSTVSSSASLSSFNEVFQSQRGTSFRVARGPQGPSQSFSSRREAY